jgi:hypothetical protein
MAPTGYTGEDIRPAYHWKCDDPGVTKKKAAPR